MSTGHDHGVTFEEFTGHVVEVDWPWPAVVAGIKIYDEWESLLLDFSYHLWLCDDQDYKQILAVTYD